MLNALTKDYKMETGAISEKIGRGKHTTRCTTLYDINSSLVADTPGFSSVDFRGMTKIDIRDNMKDMFDNLHNCKYKDCMHIKEDDCEVKRLVEQNKILLSRYNNYKSFIGGQK
jgi:ribosome biogenesis GTPase